MHKYPFLYQQCESTLGYDELIERLGKNRVLLEILDVNCKRDEITLFIEDALTEAYNELIDFLDGNGFIIEHLDKNIVHIIPMKKENIK